MCSPNHFNSAIAMESPKPADEIALDPPPASSELRDWSQLPDLAMSDVLSRLVPCLRSLSAFAATCRPWRRLFLASASTILPRIPPLILQAQYYNFSSRFLGFAPLVMTEPVSVPLPAFGATLLGASRGHLILRVGLTDARARRGTLVVTDALTGAERLAMPLPRGELLWYKYYHYACITSTHLLLFDNCRHEFASLRFPTKNPAGQEWKQHPLLRGAGAVSSVVDFHGRVLGVTDRAELLEFRVRVHAPDSPYQAAQLLPTTGLRLPDGAAFERSEFGPRLVAAGERLLLLLLLVTDPVEQRGGLPAEVKKVSVHALDMAVMRWEELDDIGEYSLFVDCTGRTAVACVGTAGCGVVSNRVYFLVSKSYYCFQAFPPGSGGEPSGLNLPWDALISDDDDTRQWPSSQSQTWVYPRLFYQS